MNHAYEQYFKDMPCYLTVQDRDFFIVEANEMFRQDFGAFSGRHCYEVYKHRTEKCEICPVAGVFQDGKVHQSEEVVTTNSGEQVNILVYATPVRNATGEISRVMEMSTNITQIRQLQSQLTSLGLLIGSISHGIKGLLNSLDGGAYMINTGMKKNDPVRVTQGWEMVQRNMVRIRSMVEDILYYAKDREPEWARIASVEVVEELAAIMESKAKERGIELTREFDAGAGEFDGDGRAIRSMLVNLLENSLDACRVDKKPGPHRVRLGLKGHPDRVEFEVEDNGIGMERETRDKVFSLFFSSKGAEGTGLGLFIANKIARSHGGRIDLASEANSGTRFTVAIPRSRAGD